MPALARAVTRKLSFASIASQSSAKRVLASSRLLASRGRSASTSATNCGTGSALASSIAPRATNSLVLEVAMRVDVMWRIEWGWTVEVPSRYRLGRMAGSVLRWSGLQPGALMFLGDEKS